MRLMESYSENRTALPSTQHIGYLLRTSPDWAYLAELRAAWEGPLVVKGVLVPEDARRLKEEGADAVWISNHAGRQFDAAPATIEALPAIREEVGPGYPLIFDSGVESGLDVLRALALGADFVMLGRALHYGLAALGPLGAAHALHIVKADMLSCMGQLGARSFADLAPRIIAP
jgi:L-lactate dehydrogenase (cytochrome)